MDRLMYCVPCICQTLCKHFIPLSPCGWVSQWKSDLLEVPRLLRAEPREAPRGWSVCLRLQVSGRCAHTQWFNSQRSLEIHSARFLSQERTVWIIPAYQHQGKQDMVSLLKTPGHRATIVLIPRPPCLRPSLPHWCGQEDQYCLNGSCYS